jgi:hypothetical protein
MTGYAHVALLVVLVGLVFAPLLLHPADLLYPRGGQATDLTITHWPAVAFNVDSLHEHGQFPLWRTTIASGGPWAANPQSWLLYPPAWLFYLLPINLTFNLLLLAHLLLAAVATYAFARRALGLEPPGAALAGLAFAAAPWLSAQLAAGHVNIVMALAWLPVALLGAQRAASTRRADGALLAGCAWAAALLNHAQMAVFVVILTSVWLILQGWGRSRMDIPRLLTLALTVALLLSAALLVPVIEALPYLNRTHMTAAEAGVFSLPWPNLLTAIIPTYGGEPELAVYLGVPLTVLAIVGLAQGQDRQTWSLLGVALGALLFALGTHGPLFPFLFRVIPGMDWLRVPSRAWMLVTFCLALLAGRGLDALSQKPLSGLARRRIARIASASLVAGLTLAAGLALLYSPAPPGAWALGAFTALSAAALLLRAHARLQPRPLAIAILLVVTADLALVRTTWTEMRTEEDAFAWGAETARFLAELEPKGLQSSTGSDSAASDRGPGVRSFRVYSPSYSLPQHTAFEHGLSLADGVDPFQLAAYADFLALAGGYEPGGYSSTLPPDLDNPSARPDAFRLGLLNVGYVASTLAIDAEHLLPLTQSDGTHLYQNERALPRAFVVAQPQESIPATLGPPLDAVPARITVHSPNRIVVETDLEGPGLLVLSEVWYPGWHAEDNGIEVVVERVEGVLRGVRLQPGPHSVEFRYAPWTVWLGVAISSSTVLGLIAVATRRYWRRP